MTSLTILSSEIRQLENLYCLNDLHKVAGSEAKHQPALFMRLDQTQELVAEICSTDMQTITHTTVKGRGKAQGTYVCKELVYAYGMWISAKFNLLVIRAFDAMQKQAPIQAPQTLTPAQQNQVQERVIELTKLKGNSYQSIYRSIKAAFHVGTYKDLTQKQYPDLCKHLGMEPLEGEYIAADQPKLAAPALTLNYPIKAQAIKSSRYTFRDMFDCGWLINLPSLLHELDKAKGQTLSVKVDNVEGIKKELVSLMHMVESQRMRLEDIAGMAARA